MVRAAKCLAALLALLGLCGAAGCSVLFAPSEEGDGGGDGEDGGGGGGGDGGSPLPSPGDPVRVTDDGGSSRAPSLTVSGDGFVVVWQDDRVGQDEIFANLLSLEGEKLGGNVQVSNQLGASESPVVTPADRGFAVAWQDRAAGAYEIYFARLKEDGSKDGEELRVSNDATADSMAPSMVPTGAGLAVGFSDNRAGNLELFCAAVAPDDEVKGPQQITNQSAPSRNPSLAWTGAQLASVWEDERLDDKVSLYFFAMGDDCARGAGSAHRLYDGTPDRTAPQLLWTGDGFALAWEADEDGDGSTEIYTARLDSSGAEGTEPVQVNQGSAAATAPSIAWTGSELLVAWQDDRHGNGEIYLARVDEEGGVEEGRLTDDSAVSATPSIAFDDGRLGVAWRDSRDGNEEIYFALIESAD